MQNISVFYKKSYYKLLINFFKNIIYLKKSSGPEILRKNLLIGLKQNKIKFNINPSIKNTFKFCIILDDINILKKLIDNKKYYNFKIIAGPNLMIMPNEYNKILYNKQIDKIIVPSKWVKNKYLEVSQNKLKKKIFIWASGINHKFWKPGKIKKIDFLIYSKYIKDKKILNSCLNFLKKNNFTYENIEYGKYSKKDYSSLLKKSKKSIFFTESESQGLAFFEAWSSQVPTLVYNPKKAYKRPFKTKTNSCPYLNNKLGDDFNNFRTFKKKIFSFHNQKFNTREWIKDNFSLKKSTKKLIEIISN